MIMILIMLKASACSKAAQGPKECQRCLKPLTDRQKMCASSGRFSIHEHCSTMCFVIVWQTTDACGMQETTHRFEGLIDEANVSASDCNFADRTCGFARGCDFSTLDAKVK